MRCIMLMFDSLNRHMLPGYSQDTWVHAPNFRRLAERAVSFDGSYCCSMPCMPARRELHTARPNFLHTAWGPIEPYDVSMVQLLRQAGVYTHLCSDHYHYWEHGGATYHTQYDTWEFFRGREGDPFHGQVADPVVPTTLNRVKGMSLLRQDWINRGVIRYDHEYPQSQTVQAGIDFIDRNAGSDRWFVQIECFDPHEPFTTDPMWRDLYPRDADEVLFDWPAYGDVTQGDREVEWVRRNYAALLSKCDASLGRVLDTMDRHGLWEDTMLVVCTDHGFLLGEHRQWGKNQMPLYEEISHTPFYVYDPRRPTVCGQRRGSLVQPMLDIGPTLLGLFGVERGPDMLGHDLSGVIDHDTPVRDAAIFGYHGSRVNITDGRYTYYAAALPGLPCYRYTLMPLQMREFVSLPVLREATLAGPFSFTQGVSLLRLPGMLRPQGDQTTPQDADLLFDLRQDPRQQRPIDEPTVRERLRRQMSALMRACDAPAEQFERMGLN